MAVRARLISLRAYSRASESSASVSPEGAEVGEGLGITFASDFGVGDGEGDSVGVGEGLSMICAAVPGAGVADGVGPTSSTGRAVAVGTDSGVGAAIVEEIRELFWKSDRNWSRQFWEMSGRIALTSRNTPITQTSIQVRIFNSCRFRACLVNAQSVE